MNINIVVSEKLFKDLSSSYGKCHGEICYEAPKHIMTAINNCKPLCGIVTINKEIVLFNFSPYFMDGDLFGSTEKNRTIVKYLLPLYVLHNLKKPS